MYKRQSLDRVEPPVWRKVLIPTYFHLDDLHDVIQSAMGWDDFHMHAFKIPGVLDGLLSACGIDDDFGDTQEADFSIQDLLKIGKKKIRYDYDFGDNWRHTITLGRRSAADPDLTYPVCIDGGGACPPEDSGGPWGYAEKLAILLNPHHEEYQETREWMGPFVTPEHFSVDEVNARLCPPSRSARPGPAKTTRPVAKSAGTKSTNTRKFPSKQRETPTSTEPRGTTITTPSGFTVTRFTAGDFIEVKPGRGFDGKATLPISSNSSFDASSFFLGQIPASIRKIDVYTEPIPSTWGTKKMSSFCKEDLNLKTTQGRAFLFFNSKRDLLRVYWHDGKCEQMIERGLFEGTFLVPLTGNSGPWMQVARDSLPKLLKASPGKKLPSPIRK